MKKFEQLVNLLKSTKGVESELHPLRKEQIKLNLLEEIAKGKSETNSFAERYILQERRFRFMPYLASLLVAIVALGGTSVAANEANPGDVLFPVKKAQEVVKLHLATNDNAQAELRLKMVEERFAELNEINKEREDKPEDKNLIEAEAESKTEISNAIETLNKVHAKLEAKGNTQAAASIKENILRFESRAKVEEETKVETEDRKQNSVEQSDDSNNRGGKLKLENGIEVEVK